MSETRASYDEEFKRNAVKLSYASPKPVKQVAEDLGVSENLLYRWQRKWTSDGDKTRYATLDKSINASKCMKNDFVRTKEKAEGATVSAAGGGTSESEREEARYTSPSDYAAPALGYR